MIFLPYHINMSWGLPLIGHVLLPIRVFIKVMILDMLFIFNYLFYWDTFANLSSLWETQGRGFCNSLIYYLLKQYIFY